MPQCNHRPLPSFLGPSRDDPNCLPRKKGGGGVQQSEKNKYAWLGCFLSTRGCFPCVCRSVGRHRCRRAGKLEKGGFIILRDQSGGWMVCTAARRRGGTKRRKGEIYSRFGFWLCTYVHHSPYRLHAPSCLSSPASVQVEKLHRVRNIL